MTSPGRAEQLGALARETFDVLVIGAGITGAGVARDAALRGLRVALVEQDDYASGTSSRSSRLIHGGVRYLEHGQFGLVFESSRERRLLLRIAPHLVRPLAFTWPVYARSRVRRWHLAAALTLYDLLALFRNVRRHASLDATDVVRYEPCLRREGLLGGARYHDASTDDARLTLANVLSARAASAVVLNHARVESLVRTGERIAGAVIRDGRAGGGMTVRARVVVNATGPWSDAVSALAGARVTPRVRGSKGVHIAVPRARLGTVDAVTLLAPQDGRVMFVLPAGDFAIVGTTDTYEDVSPSTVRASDADVDYLLAAADHFFPAAALVRDDVVAAWAGLRPLARGATGTGDPGAVSREHAIGEPVAGLISVTGGKLTTYRAMAAEVVDAVQRALGIRITRSRTATQPLPGGDGFVLAHELTAARAACGDEAVARRLVQAHGIAWRAVWGLATSDVTLAARIATGRPYILAELRYAVQHEMAETLGDLLVRRVPLAFETRDNGRDAARRLAPRVAAWLGWDEARVALELAAYEAEVGRIFTVLPA